MKRWRLVALLFGMMWVLAGSAAADIAFPARLDVVVLEQLSPATRTVLPLPVKRDRCQRRADPLAAAPDNPAAAYAAGGWARRQ